MLVQKQFEGALDQHIYIFYNRARNKLKLLAYHRNGRVLLYKQLDKKRFTLSDSEERREELLFQPAVLKVIEHVRIKYACRHCEIIKTPKAIE